MYVVSYFVIPLPVHASECTFLKHFLVDNRQECDEYDFTTTGEISPNDESDEEVKRKPKKKVYPGFVTDSESCKEKVDGSGREAEPDVRNENQVVESRKRDITSLLPDPPEKLKERHIQNKSALFSKHLIGSSAPQQQQSTSPSDHKQRSRSPRENTKTRETSPTSQRGSHSFRGGRSNSSNRLQGSSSTSQLSTSYEQRQRSRSPTSSGNNTKNRESSQTSQRGSNSFRGGRSNSSNRLQGSSSTSQLSTSYEQRQRSRSPTSSGNNTKNRESSQTSQRGSNSFRGGRSNSSNRLQGSSSTSQLSTSYEQRQRSRSPRSSGNNTKNRESSQTSQRGSNSFRGGRSNSSNRLQGSSSISQLSTSYEQRQRSRSPRSSENNTKNRESSQTYYEQRQRSRSPIESFEPSDGDRSPRSPSPPDDQLASAEDDSNTDVVYPMTEERFQKRVIYLLSEIRDLLKKPSRSHAAQCNLERAETMEEFFELENILDNVNEEASLREYLRRIGGVGSVDLLKRAMSRMMSNSVMSKINMKGKKNKFPFIETNLYKVISDVVMMTYPEVTEIKIQEEMAKFLKYAPERAGGGGRQRRE
uniref:Serine/arginine repetitive matrix protein 2-like n=1 Tax=Crassostrea virginica TaxID=6565 RepID=A0A8B8C652_CRAVI|nr:serine/arginine repetitive matrix protein 2-like [Crassostrea virginica]